MTSEKWFLYTEIIITYSDWLWNDTTGRSESRKMAHTSDRSKKIFRIDVLEVPISNVFWYCVQFYFI